MRREAVICDVCGRVKQAANHWFVAEAVRGIIRILPASGNDLARGALSQDVCGDDCLHKWISINLSDITKETHAEEQQPTENI